MRCCSLLKIGGSCQPIDLSKGRHHEKISMNIINIRLNIDIYIYYNIYIYISQCQYHPWIHNGKHDQYLSISIRTWWIIKRCFLSYWAIKRSTQKTEAESMALSKNSPLFSHHGDSRNVRLVGGWATPLKNMNVNWDDNRNSILMGKCKKWQPNHQAVNYHRAFLCFIRKNLQMHHTLWETYKKRWKITIFENYINYGNSPSSSSQTVKLPEAG